MFGALTFLPIFLQVVHGISPTLSGVHLLPMMAGLLVTSILSGRLITRTGHYKLYPILGTAVMIVGLFLLSRMTEHTLTLGRLARVRLPAGFDPGEVRRDPHVIATFPPQVAAKVLHAYAQPPGPPTWGRDSVAHPPSAPRGTRSNARWPS
jgi:hypothetical protein